MMRKAVIGLLAMILLSSAQFALAGYRHRPDNSVERAGDIGAIAIPASALAYSMIIGDMQGVWQLTESFASTMLATEILKRSVQAERPYPMPRDKKYSFPSGHAASAFAGAAYWERRYGWKIGVPMYLAATYVGYSRVYAYKHRWGDIVGGAVIGYGFNLLFTSRYTKNDGVSAALSPMPGGARFDLRWLF
ncbi:MAG: phosphatase PAP2 family protein [Deltaproteobacteria bacterium]|jgi:membrane-associated phospholipid phosphatase|nr:phosphatase PAP2 family protein [Deltaproteobacteria bacterium]